MPSVGEWARSVPHSGIREIVHLVAERRDGIARLEVGEPGYPTPAHIVKAGQDAAAAGALYTASAGRLDLREAIAAKLMRVNGLDARPEQVVVCQGAVQGCALLVSALVRQGLEVLVPDPAWPNYEMLVTLHGGTNVRYPLRPSNGFIPDPEEVASLITDRTAAIIINTPGNPSGAVFPPDVVKALADLAVRHDLPLICDEVYDELIFEGAAANAAAHAPDHVIGVYSFSKTYAMTGWRIGYFLAPQWLAPEAAKLQEPLISCVSEVSQAAALAAVEGPQDCVAEMRDGYRVRRDLAVQLLQDAGIATQTPHGAFYLMLPLAEGVDSRAAAIDLLEERVSVAPGTAFGDAATDHFRLSLAGDEPVLREGIARIATWYERTSGGQKLAGRPRR